VRVLIADHFATRVGIRLALDDQVEVCAEADDAAEATALAEREQPDVCLVGVDVPGGGVLAVRGVRAAAPSTSVIVLAAVASAEDLLAVVRAGAVGYLPGTIDPEALLRVVGAVSQNEAAVPRSLVLELLRELRATTEGGAEGLTARETQVLRMLRRGESTAAIAGELGISSVTVRRHVSSLLRKLGVEDRAALAA
jgi:two-component system, NarL family, nitrate/nitrite response regulator NarL